MTLTEIVLIPITPGLSASTHTDTVGVPSITVREDELKCRSNGVAASEEEVVSLTQDTASILTSTKYVSNYLSVYYMMVSFSYLCIHLYACTTKTLENVSIVRGILDFVYIYSLTL